MDCSSFLFQNSPPLHFWNYKSKVLEFKEWTGFGEGEKKGGKREGIEEKRGEKWEEWYFAWWGYRTRKRLSLHLSRFNSWVYETDNRQINRKKGIQICLIFTSMSLRASQEEKVNIPQSGEIWQLMYLYYLNRGRGGLGLLGESKWFWKKMNELLEERWKIQWLVTKCTRVWYLLDF